MGCFETGAAVITPGAARAAGQSQLERLQTERAAIGDQVQLSTLSLDLSQKTKVDNVAPGGFHGGLVDGWNALVDTVNHIVKIVGVLLPWTVIAAALYGAYLLTTRRRRS